MRNILLALALVAGGSFYLTHWIELDGPAAVVWKGSGVALLALWAGAQARDIDGWLLAALLAFGALGDVLLETHGLTIGALAFLAGHIVASALYLRNRVGPLWVAGVLALGVAALCYAIPIDRSGAPGIALYALGLGAMMGTAWISAFPRHLVGLGAALFAVSDVLIFSKGGFLSGSEVPGLLIWPTYFAGQALIAWGVATGLERRA